MCVTDGRYIRLFHVDPANKHGIRVLKENRNSFIEVNKRMHNNTDKSYVDEEFARDMKSEGIRYIAIKIIRI